MAGELPKVTQEIANLPADHLAYMDFLAKDVRTWTRLPDSLSRDLFKNFRPTLDPKLLNPPTISRCFAYGPNPLANFRNAALSGASGATAAWWAMRGTIGYWYSASLNAAIGGAKAMASAPAAKVMAAGALGFAAGVSIDQAQEALFGQSYTAAGVKAFLEMPTIWGSAEAAPKQLVDAWDEYFSWTNYPDQAMAWLKRNLG